MTRRWRLAFLALAAVVLADRAANARDTTPIETWIDQPFHIPAQTDVLASPASGAATIARLRGGVEILVVGVVAQRGWLQIKLPDGKTLGYVPTSAIPDATGQTADKPSAPPLHIDGHPIVRDTATLILGHREIHLFGVVGETGDLADGLQSYISANGGTVSCLPQDPGHFVCLLPNNMDIALVALLNGAARLTVDAPDLYREQEQAARAKQVGIWAQP